MQRIVSIDIGFAVSRAGGNPRGIKRLLGEGWMQRVAGVHLGLCGHVFEVNEGPLSVDRKTVTYSHWKSEAGFVCANSSTC